jgi:hypothetical protein
MNPPALCLLLIRNILPICAVVKRKIKGELQFFGKMLMRASLITNSS